MHGKLVLKSSSLTLSIDVWNFTWVVKSINKSEFVKSPEMVIESEHVWFVSWWSLDLSHNVGFDDMALGEGRPVHHWQLLQMLSLSVHKHVVLHSLGGVKLLIGVKSWLSWALSKSTCLSSELRQTFVLIVHVQLDFWLINYKQT